MSVPAYAASTTTGTQTTWQTFHDPVYGFSLKYPGSWTLIPEKDGSHITLFNPATRTAMSPIVTTQTGTPASALKQAQSVTGAKTRTIAGHQAVDSLTPYVPVSQMRNQDAAVAGGPQQTRQVILPVTNTSGTTNVYTFLLTQPTDSHGKISAAEQTDLQTFEAILNSFTLPTKVTSVLSPTKAASTISPLTTSGCNRICWADANWNYNYYDDSSGSYSFACDSNGYYYGYSTSTSTCVNGNIYGAQVSSGNTYFQPNFQCADFVSRTLTQDGLIPGLNNGGVNGSFPASPSIGGYSSYKAANGGTYYLWNVGVPGTPGLSNYLLDNGLAINVHQNVAQAAPGDVVFFIDSSTGNYYHTMFITAISGSSLVLDGHNMAQYHVVVSASGLDIYHLPTGTITASSTSTGLVPSNGRGGSSIQIGYLPGNLAQMDTFVLGADHTVWNIWKTADSNSPWSAWGILVNSAVQLSKPAVGVLSDGRLNLFATSSDGNVWSMYKLTTDPGCLWSSWGSVGKPGAGATGQVQIGTLPDGRMSLFALDVNGTAWGNWKTTTSTSSAWNGWVEQGTGNGGVALIKLTVGTLSDGRLNLFATASNGTVWSTYKLTTDATSGWSSWGSVGTPGAGAGQVQVGQLEDGRMELFTVGKDGNLWANYKTTSNTNSAWSGWGSIGQPSGSGGLVQS
jgi:Putative amidase domain